MKFGYKFLLTALIKVVILGIVGMIFLWDYFGRNSAKDEPVVVYVYIGFVALIWIGFVTALALAMTQAKRAEQKAGNSSTAAPAGASPRHQEPEEAEDHLRKYTGE